MPRTLLSCFLLASLFLAGCATPQHNHGGAFVTEYQPGEKPDTTTTPYRAEYVLFHWPAPPGDAPPHTWRPDTDAVEMFVRELDGSKTIGFKKENDHLVAVAGTETLSLDEGRYCWHITRATEYRGCELAIHEAGETTRELIALPFETAWGIVMLPVVIVAIPVFLVLFGWIVFCH